MVRERMGHVKKAILEQRKVEKEIKREIQNYLVETMQEGIRLDDHTYLKLEKKDRKIALGKKNYESKIKDLLASKGITDEGFIKALLNKTKDVVQTQKCVITEK